MNKAKVTIEQLFELGAHFGHRKRFWNPHMEEYIFCEKNNIHIINLYKTQEKILELYDTFKNLSAVGNKIMIVGTKRVASSYVKEFGEKTGMPYISHRWLGGMLTNWKTIKIPINKLLEFEENKTSGNLDKMIKKEAVQLEKEMKKWELNRGDVLKKRAEKQEQKAKVVTKKNKVEAAEAVTSDSGDASTNDEGPNEDQLGENIPEQPEGNDIDESSQEEE